MVDDLRFGMAISNVISDEPVKVTRSSVGAPPSGAWSPALAVAA
ncbi:MAG: hypothetical protein AAFY28_21950 [Actinomycetota bacterium]